MLLYDVIFINEHHREEPLPSDFAEDYEIFYGALDQRKGGVLMLIRKELKPIIPFPSLNTRDSLMVKIRLDGQHIMLHCVYINPD